MTLTALGVGSLTLTPTFDPEVTEYTATTSNSTNKITATAKDEAAEVKIESEDATIAADGTATWAAGDNVVTVTVTKETEVATYTNVYTVTVTKTAQGG